MIKEKRVQNLVVNMFTYKGYTAHVEIDLDANILCGRVLDIKDVITFKGETVEEARQAFHDSVDDYLEWCEELGEEPDKPFSGKLPFRTTPEHHRKIFIAATKAGKSINAWMDEVLTKAADQTIRA
jgi:predicted HicB family RNase H-like nuclease